MSELLGMAGLVVIGATAVWTASTGIDLPAGERLTVLLPLVAGAGAGLSALGVAMVAIPDDASDTAYAASFLGASIVGSIVVAVILRRLLARETDR
jgi:hypothetical protein